MCGSITWKSISPHRVRVHRGPVREEDNHAPGGRRNNIDISEEMLLPEAAVQAVIRKE